MGDTIGDTFSTAFFMIGVFTTLSVIPVLFATFARFAQVFMSENMLNIIIEIVSKRFVNYLIVIV